MQPENQMISLAELQDLMTRLEDAMDLRSDRWHALKVTLAWAGEHQLLMPPHPEPEIRLDLPKLTIPVPPSGWDAWQDRPLKDFSDAEFAAASATVEARLATEALVLAGVDLAKRPDESIPEYLDNMTDLARKSAQHAAVVISRLPPKYSEKIAARLGEPVPNTAPPPAPRKPYTPKPGPAKAAYAKPEDAKPKAPAAPVSDPEMHAHLNALGCKAPWTPALDLELAEGLAKGIMAEVLADQLGIEAFRCRDRFKALLADFAPIEGQKRLLTALRERARK